MRTSIRAEVDGEFVVQVKPSHRRRAGSSGGVNRWFGDGCVRGLGAQSEGGRAYRRPNIIAEHFVGIPRRVLWIWRGSSSCSGKTTIADVVNYGPRSVAFFDSASYSASRKVGTYRGNWYCLSRS